MTNATMRSADLRQMLVERQRELQSGARRHLRDGFTDGPHEIRGNIDAANADIQGDIELALLQVRGETLTRIAEALVRLDAGSYGSCFGCDDEISARRLRALPFAVRCQACEERREIEQNRTRSLAHQWRHLSLFRDAAGS